MGPRAALRRWFPSLLVATAIFVGSILPAPPGSSEVVGRFVVPLDLLAHVIGYALLGGALAGALADGPLERRTVAAAVIALVAVYGTGLEILQGVLPTRDFSTADVVANVVGGALGVLVLLYRERNG